MINVQNFNKKDNIYVQQNKIFQLKVDNIVVIEKNDNIKGDIEEIKEKEEREI